MFEGGFKVFYYFFSQQVEVGEVGDVFKAFVAQPEDVEVGFISMDEYLSR